MLHWFVVRSKHRNETLLWQQLVSRGIEVYYPQISTHNTKHLTQKARPYFPGYMFVHVDLDVLGRSTLQWLPGTLGLVCFGGEPAIIPDSILHGIEKRVGRLNETWCELSQSVKRGDEVEICSGPLAGYRGIFDCRLSDREHVIVFLRLICDQQRRLELPVSQIMPTARCQIRL